jgi:hypothetical protein
VLSVAVTPKTETESEAVTGSCGPFVAVTVTVPVAPGVVPAVKVTVFPLVALKLPREEVETLHV